MVSENKPQLLNGLSTWHWKLGKYGRDILFAAQRGLALAAPPCGYPNARTPRNYYGRVHERRPVRLKRGGKKRKKWNKTPALSCQSACMYILSQSPHQIPTFLKTHAGFVGCNVYLAVFALSTWSACSKHPFVHSSHYGWNVQFKCVNSKEDRLPTRQKFMNSGKQVVCFKIEDSQSCPCENDSKWERKQRVSMTAQNTVCKMFIVGLKLERYRFGLSVCLIVCLSDCLFIWVFVCLIVCLSVCLLRFHS